jgi:hypothetical protein
MSYLKPYDPSADYVVVKSFIESGIAYQEGDAYVPRFDSRKRKFRHYVARRIARKELAKPVVEEVVEESKVVEEPVKTTPKKTTKAKAKAQTVDSE